ncbi:MAG: hypothetical protein J6I72_02370 [Muribaculaceae bacterium]|nr:hypothetical protein [Muribaculaceae bacterium]
MTNGVVRRYRTALSRHHRSAGFGIHSPHAFKFVTQVLRGRLPYYAYEDIAMLRRAVINATRSRWPHPRIISEKNAKLLFRVVNHFNPQCIMQVGTCYGVSCACMLAVSSTSRVVLCEPELDRFTATREVLALLGDRVECHDAVAATIAAYREQVGAELPFILVNDITTQQEAEALSLYVKELLAGCCVVMMRNLSRNKLLNQLWEEWRSYAPHGQTFTNEKLAVIVASPKLQREDFFLWF